MICSEKGTVPPSEYFFFPEPEGICGFFYHVPVAGHFYCKDGYSIERKGGVSPLIFLILSGTLNFRTDEGTVQTKAGQAVLLDCSKPHHYYCTDACEFLFAHFSLRDSQAITAFLTDGGKRMIFPDTQGKIKSCMEEPLRLLHNGASPSAYALSRMISNILSYLPENDGQNAGSPPLNPARHPSIEKAQQFIRHNLMKNITLDGIADNSDISKYHLCKLFKKELGISPLEYVSQSKINLAETMLLTTGRSISEIAEALCYSSSASFINAFKARKGITPNNYRKSAHR